MDYSKLERIINKYDLVGLLKIGAPKDEYSPEVKIILKQLKLKQTKKEIEKIVKDVFVYYFYKELLEGKEKQLHQIAGDIYAHMNVVATKQSHKTSTSP